MTKTKVRVVVLDGVDWKYVRDQPTVARDLWDLVGMPAQGPSLPPGHWTESNATGCAGLLRACDAPITPSAVCALLSGRDDGIGWFSEDRYTTSQELIRTRPWFPELGRHDMTIGLCNVPLTWPAFPLPRGSWMTSGFPIAPSTLTNRNLPWKWPSTLGVDGYPIETFVRDVGPGGSKDLPMLRTAESQVVDWFLHKAPRADVEIIWLRSTDSAGHHAWGTPAYDETIAHAAHMAKLLSVGTENLIVISDHGFDALESPRCADYHKTSHGDASRSAHLCGGHSSEGILFARGERIFARGILREQRLVDVAGGIFDLLQIPPAPGMRVGTPAWSSPMGPEDDEAIRQSLADLGYDTGGTP